MRATTAGLLIAGLAIAGLAAGVAAGRLLRPSASDRAETDELRARIDAAIEARKDAEEALAAAETEATAARRELRAAERVEVNATDAEPAAGSESSSDAGGAPVPNVVTDE